MSKPFKVSGVSKSPSVCSIKCFRYWIYFIWPSKIRSIFQAVFSVLFFLSLTSRKEKVPKYPSNIQLNMNSENPVILKKMNFEVKVNFANRILYFVLMDNASAYFSILYISSYVLWAVFRSFILTYSFLSI